MTTMRDGWYQDNDRPNDIYFGTPGDTIGGIITGTNPLGTFAWRRSGGFIRNERLATIEAAQRWVETGSLTWSARAATIA